MKKPFVSVIVPVYNVEKYISACVRSLIDQTYPNFEVILVDDGSTDGCPAICDDFAAKYDNISVIHQENRGLSGARNTGIDRAKGELLCFVDSDDEDLREICQRFGVRMSSIIKLNGFPEGYRPLEGDTILLRPE